MPLMGIAADVTKAMVGALLTERDPEILDRTYGDDGSSMFEALVSQVAVEVVPITGPDPDGATRDLAVQCIAYGVASSVEYSAFPEQQTAGNTGRGWFLKQKFTELLNMLRALPKTGPGSIASGVSRGRFPEPSRYPDALRTYPRRSRW